ncbi:MAG: SDR family oxidoreductase [Desulfobulbaceae bacterium]|jgi:enoyl-[acyl-carrier protein] reductase I|nr:SDR family oxidoreductase [Desulfobulbaceae bacterium]
MDTPRDFLQLADKRLLVFGLANKKSVACAIGKTLAEAGAEVIHVVRSEERRLAAEKIFPAARVFICDVEREENIRRLRDEVAALVAADGRPIQGLAHSLAFANYSDGIKPFHQIKGDDFLQAMNISCFSLIGIAGAFADLLAKDAAVVTVSISTTKMAAENYGYMGPVKAALDSSLVFLAKSFSAFSEVRFNAVAPGLLKTSASAGIPGYVESYLYAEKVIPRHRAVTTQEAADAAAFLLSPRSSGINGQSLTLDAGMSFNYFDREIVRAVNR